MLRHAAEALATRLTRSGSISDRFLVRRRELSDRDGGGEREQILAQQVDDLLPGIVELFAAASEDPPLYRAQADFHRLELRGQIDDCRISRRDRRERRSHLCFEFGNAGDRIHDNETHATTTAMASRQNTLCR